jgi:hypothetical protein
MPPDDEPVELKATWDSDAEGFRITNVPIGLAPIVRAINEELGALGGSGIAQFSWSALPEELFRVTS